MKAFVLLIAVSLFVFTAFAQQKVGSGVDDAEFRRLAEQWREAYNSKDAKNLFPMYTEDARYISSHVPGLVADGRDKLIANFQKGMSSGGHIDSIEVLSIDLSCDLASILCKYEATNSSQKATGRNLLVVKKIDGQWLIVLHVTVV